MADFDFSTYVDPRVAVILLFIGWVIKNNSKLEKISNDLIPIVLVVFGVILNVILNGPTVDSFFAGILTAIFCVGLHGGTKDTVNYLTSNKKEGME